MNDRKQKLQNTFLMIIDAICLVAGYLLASYIIFNFRSNPLHINMQRTVSGLWLVFVTYFCVFLFFNMNRYLLQRDKYEELIYVIKVNLFVAIVIAVVFFAAKQMQLLSRGVWVLTVILNTVFMYLGILQRRIFSRASTQV